MNAKTLKALKASIAHWKRMSTGNPKRGEDIGPDHCHLCKLFIDNGCIGCPVMDITGEEGCDGTPYESARRASIDSGNDSALFKEAARIEYNFLRALLPEKQR